MKENTEISERIGLIIDYLDVSKNDFAKSLGYNRSQAIYDIVNGKAKPSYDFFSKFMDSEYSETFNLDWIVTGKGEFLKRKVEDSLYNDSITKSITFSDKTKSTENVILDNMNQVEGPYYGKMPQVVTVDKQGNDNVVLVPVKAQAGYLTGFGDPTYIKKLPTYNLPNIKNGTFRMFQVNGHSMHPTLHDKSYVVGEWVENWVKDIKDNRLYIVVAESDNAEGVLIKRVLNRLKKYGNLYLKPDNRKEYYNITLQPDEIKEVWEVKLYLGWELPDPAVLYDRVSDLEADIEYLKDKLKGKN